MECGIRYAISGNSVSSFEKYSPARSFSWSGCSNRLPELGERVENVFRIKVELHGGAEVNNAQIALEIEF